MSLIIERRCGLTKVKLVDLLSGARGKLMTCLLKAVSCLSLFYRFLDLQEEQKKAVGRFHLQHRRQ